MSVQFRLGTGSRIGAYTVIDGDLATSWVTRGFYDTTQLLQVLAMCPDKILAQRGFKRELTPKELEDAGQGRLIDDE